MARADELLLASRPKASRARHGSALVAFALAVACGATSTSEGEPDSGLSGAGGEAGSATEGSPDASVGGGGAALVDGGGGDGPSTAGSGGSGAALVDENGCQFVDSHAVPGVDGGGAAEITAGNLQFTVPMVTVTGQVTSDVAGLPGAVLLRNSETHDAALVSQVGRGTFSRRFVPGVYDVVYSPGGFEYGEWSPGQERSSVPAVEGPRTFTIQTGVDLRQGGPLAVHIPAVELVVEMAGTLDEALYAQPTPTLDAEESPRIPLQATEPGKYRVPVFPGSYDIYYGSMLLAPGVDVSDDVTLQLAQPAPVVVSGVATIDGGLAWEQASIHFLRVPRPETDFGVSVSPDSSGAYSVALLPGAYEVRLFGTSPRGGTVPVQALTLTTDTTLDFDVPAVDVAVMSSGFTFPGGAVLTGALVARRSDGSGVVEIGNIEDAPFSVSVVPGVYDIELSGRWKTVVLKDVDLSEDAAVAINLEATTLELLGVQPESGFTQLLSLSNDLGTRVECGYGSCVTPPGIYDLMFDRKWRVRRDVDITQNGSIDLSDLRPVELSGTFSLAEDGVVAPEAWGYAHYVRFEASDVVVSTGITGPTGATLSRPLLLAGVYDVYYTLDPGDGSWNYEDGGNRNDGNDLTSYPVNVHARVGCINVR
jgi:hypothetical protein